jgi:hypothetical protein
VKTTSEAQFSEVLCIMFVLAEYTRHNICIRMTNKSTKNVIISSANASKRKPTFAMKRTG